MNFADWPQKSISTGNTRRQGVNEAHAITNRMLGV
jgi:hypothetical protein